MSVRAHWVGFATASLLLLAGCSGAPATPADVQDDLESFDPASIPEGQGAVTGFVGDDSLLPLGGALVGIVELELTTNTRADGAFLLSGIEPGDYTLAAQRPGYASASKRIQVVAGSVIEVSLTLQALASNDPYIDIQSWTGYVECQVGTSVILANCLPIQNTINENNLPNPTNTNQLGWFLVLEPRDATEGGLYEMIWEQSSSQTGYKMNLNVEKENAGLSGADWGRASGPSPIAVRVSNNEPYVFLEPENPDNDEIQVRVFPQGETPPNVAVAQTVDVWSSVFYYADPGEAYSALPDE